MKMIAILGMSLMLLVTFLLVGYFITKKFLDGVIEEFYFFPITLLIGFTISLYTSWCVVSLMPRIPIWIPILPFIVASLVSIILNLVDFQRLILHKRFKTPQLIAIAVGFMSTFPMSNGLFKTGFRFRIGPDLIGWGISSNYLRNTEGLNQLAGSIESQLSINDFNLAIQNTIPGISIYSLSSFNEQVAAEFLFGSKRIGLQAFVGGISSLLGNLNSIFIIWALVALFFMIAAYSVLVFLEKSKVPLSVKVLAFASTMASPALVAPILEGGVWHIILFTMIVMGLALNCRVGENTNETKSILTVIFLIFSLGFTMNSDIFIASIPLFVSSIVKLGFKNSLSGIKYLPLIFLVHTPMLASFYSSLQSRNRDSFVGGWSASKIPFPSDIFGLTPWIESTGIAKTTSIYLDFGLIVKILCSAILLYSLRYLLPKDRKVLISYLLSIFIFFAYFLQYFLNHSASNTYIPWKLSFVLIAITPFALVSMFSGYSRTLISSPRKEKTAPRKSSIQSKNKDDRISLIVLLVTLAVLTQALRVQFDWRAYSVANRVVSLSTSAFVKPSNSDFRALNKFDIQSSCVPWVQSLALISDLRLITSRTASISARPSKPSRTTVYLLDLKSDSCAGFQLGNANKVYQGGAFDLIGIPSTN